MGKGYKHLTRYDRVTIETLLNTGKSVQYIADYLGVNRSTIYREIKKGTYTHLNSEWIETKAYSCDLGQAVADEKKTHLGKALKVGSDIAFADFIEDKIINARYSPSAALAEASAKFDTRISVRTLYRYIDNHVFYLLDSSYLPIKGGKKKKKYKRPVQKRKSAGTSIEKRPAEISRRDTFGHWEMDTVKGKQGKTKGCFLVLTERLTRMEIVRKLSDQGSRSVVEQINELERLWGDRFKDVFKTITVDNGVEFSDASGIETSPDGTHRIDCYYCHAYSSYERGSNENNNRLIRRHAPKGTDLDMYGDKDVMFIQEWINDYPRKIFNWRTSRDLFIEQLHSMGIFSCPI